MVTFTWDSILKLWSIQYLLEYRLKKIVKMKLKEQVIKQFNLLFLFEDYIPLFLICYTIYSSCHGQVTFGYLLLAWLGIESVIL